jgi:multimeric flavodoxin WrbA
MALGRSRRKQVKKVLGIVGSPRKKGNTDVLVSRLLDGASGEGAAVGKIYLGDLRVRECDGCHVCWQEKPCPKKDDMNDIFVKIGETDAIVFGTPVYWYGPTALMKGCIDRFVYFNCPGNRGKIHGKGAAIIVPFEEEDPATVEPVLTFFEKSLSYLGMRAVGRVVAPGVTVRGEVRRRVDLMDEAFQLGVRLAQ